MAYLLRFDGVNDYVLLDNLCSFQVGADAYTIELDIKVDAWPTSGNKGLLGSSATQSTGITLRASSPTNSLSVLHGGAFAYASGANLVILGARHKYRLEHDANGSYRWYRDGIEHSSGVYGSGGGSASIQRVGMSSSTANWTAFDLFGLKMTGFGLSPIDIQPSLSGGAGTRLTDANGVNSGTLTNGPAWVFYSEGGETITGAISVNMPQMSVQASTAHELPTITSSTAFTMPQMTIEALTSHITQLITSSIDFTMPQMIIQAASEVALPDQLSAVTFTMPQMIVAINRKEADIHSLIEFRMPQMQVAALVVNQIGYDIGTFNQPGGMISVNRL